MHKYTKYKISDTTKSNLWLIKPNSYNRGRGVFVSNKLCYIKKLINDFSSGLKLNISNANK